MFNIIDRYIIVNFLFNFVILCSCFGLLIFIVDLFEISDKAKDFDVGFLTIAKLALMKLPQFINQIIVFLVMVCAIITFYFMAMKSEIIVISSHGYSFSRILMPLAFVSLLLGLFYTFIFSQVNVYLNQKYEDLSAEIFQKEDDQLIKIENGIWLKQDNLQENGGQIIIRSNEVAKNGSVFQNLTLWFFDSFGNFYQRLEGKEALLINKTLIIENIIVNDRQNINQISDEYILETSFDANFIKQKIIHNFSNETLFSIYNLPKIIKDLRSAGFNAIKFSAHLNLLLAMPIFFMAISIIGAFFGIHFPRNQSKIFRLIAGIFCGFIIYFISNVSIALAKSAILPMFVAIWLFVILIMLIAILLINKLY